MMKKRLYGILSFVMAGALLAGCGGTQAGSFEGSESVKEESTTGLIAESAASESVVDHADPDNAEEKILSVPVILTGGTGRATITSPAEVRAHVDGTYTAVLEWSSSNYDFMMVDGERYEPVNTEGNSVFEIPIPAPDCSMEIAADTVAMSTPHLIEYTLTFGREAEMDEESAENNQSAKAPAEVPACLKLTGSMELEYAKGYTIDICEDGSYLVTIAGTDQYLIVPEGKTAPAELPDSVMVIQQPVNNIYLVSSSAMDMFADCNAMDTLGFCGLEKNGWYLDAPKEAMDAGTLVYAGKYSAPDYEALLAGGCELVIENRMITHSPEVLEEFAHLGIPAMVEQASYETSPQGRMEWIRLYGILTGHEKEAEQAFEHQLECINALEGTEDTGLSVAYFYVTTNKLVSIRNANDYIPQMISIAGGEYAFSDYGVDSTSSTSTIQIEEFYASAMDADILIYNSSIAGGLKNMEEFLDLSPLFADLKAVKNGQVYCTQANLYQSSMKMGQFTSDLYAILHGDSENLNFLYLLK